VNDGYPLESSSPWRAPLIAALANLVVPPVGHLYAGALWRGVILWIAMLLVALAAMLAVVSVPGIAATAIAFLGAAFRVACLSGDAAMLARRKPPPTTGPGVRWYAYLGVAAVSMLVGAVGDGLGKARIVQAFRMPSESMAPALLVGDYFFVDKRPAATRTPKRGDIVVYGSTGDPSVQFAKRVIGLPGETIEIRDQQVLIDGRALVEPYAVHLAHTLEAAELSPRDNLPPTRLGPGEVFVMGDNRENSNDSRFTGPIPIRALQGRAITVYLSLDFAHAEFRWSRIGMRIR
jgi:signal peptidase I